MAECYNWRSATNFFTCMNKITKLITTIMFVFSCAVAWALPGTTAVNLQTTNGVTTSIAGSTLTVTAPNKSVLTWQAFGSGTNAIGVGETIAYTLPDARASVLNIVAGGANTTIDGTISSNGNVFVLNPNGIIIGGGARIDTNAFYISTSDNPSFASYYFQQNGKLPVQDGLATAAGTAAINNNAIINVTDNITILARNVDVAGALIQGALNITADGNVTVGSNGVTYVLGNTTINNPTGATTLGVAGNTFISNNNVIVNSGAGSTVTNPNTTTFTTKTLAVNAGTGDVNLSKVNSSAVSVTGNNITVAISSAANPVVNVTANGAVAVTAPGFVTANVVNTSPTAPTSVTASGSLTLGGIHINSAGNTSFTGSSVTDSVNNNFVYGPVLFRAISGDVSITKSGNSFGPISVTTTGNATVYESAALNLEAINVSKLTARTGQYAFQTGVITAPALTLTATDNVTLTNAGNMFTAVTVTGNNVTLTSSGVNTLNTTNVTGNNVTLTSTGALVLGNVVAGGTLTVTSGGTVTQATDTKVKAYGVTTLVGTALTLASTGNQFGALNLDTNGGSITLAEESTLNIAGLRSGATSLTSNGSVITSGTAAIAAGNVAINAGADVVLGANFNTTGTLTINAINGVADLSLLSFANNLRSVYPSVVAKNYKAPTP